MTNSKTLTQPELLVNSAHGIYIPVVFLETICAEIKAQIPAEDRVLLRDVEHENHLDAWIDTLDRVYKLGGQKIYLEQFDGDLWAVPAVFRRSKEYKEFNPEY